MRRFRKAIAATALLAMTAAPAGAANRVASVQEASHATVVRTVSYDPYQPICMDECLIKPPKLAGSRAIVAR